MSENIENKGKKGWCFALAILFFLLVIITFVLVYKQNMNSLG